MSVSALRYFLLRPYYLALLIILLLVFWMLSAPLNSQISEAEKEPEQLALPTVVTTHFVPEKVVKKLTLYAQSEANSRATIRAQVAGKILQVSQPKGSYVEAGKHLVSIDKSELPEHFAQAQAQLIESELNYNAVKSLNDKGLQGRVLLAEMKSLYLAAQTQVKLLQLQLKRTQVTAPFSGFLQEQFADLGDYLAVGDAIFSLENSDPIVIRADVTEHHVTLLKLGQQVSATLLSGETVSGHLSFISSLADSDSSTFRIEAEFANPDFKIFSGISAKLTIPLYSVAAIYVSPSVLAIDEQGNLGVKLVVQDEVLFQAANLLEASNDGVWLSGFDAPVDIITRGQGFVKAGARVLVTAAQE